MFVPLKDDNPLRVIRFQYVALALIVLNIALFLITNQWMSKEASLVFLNGFGVVPSELLDVQRVGAQAFNPVSEPVTLLTSLFLHAGWLHLIGNLAFLWVFGDNVEDAFGHFGFLLFYLLCGVVSAMTHAFMWPDSHDPLIGASGAVSGVMAAYLLLYPKASVWVLFLMRIPLKVPAWIALIGWIGFQVVSLFLEQPDVGYAVAWWAHIGGFAMGLIFTVIIRSPVWFRHQS
jgi:membrane associated rhomboid family serine protease